MRSITHTITRHDIRARYKQTDVSQAKVIFPNFHPTFAFYGTIFIDVIAIIQGRVPEVTGLSDDIISNSLPCYQVSNALLHTLAQRG